MPAADDADGDAGGDGDVPVVLPESVLDPFPRFSLYNSPYPAHDRGCAVDLYPGTEAAPSPVAGTVRDTRTVRCPDRHYAVDEDHLILVDCGADSPGTSPGLVARILHVDPAVEAGDSVAVGDSLGTLVRSGFFGQWVDDHVHLGFRTPDQNPHRAGGSLPLTVDVPVDPLAWDGTGEVVEVGPTHARLDSPAHTAPGERFAGIAADDGRVLDGGLAHYGNGGVLTPAAGEGADPDPGPLSLLGTRVGVPDGRDVAWNDVEVLADGERIVGLSLFAARGSFGAKIVAFDHDFAVGDRVAVAIRPTDDPVRLD